MEEADILRTRLKWLEERQFSGLTPLREIGDWLIEIGRLNVQIARRSLTVEPETPLTSLAHPEWPYTGTPHAWPKFKI